MGRDRRNRIQPPVSSRLLVKPSPVTENNSRLYGQAKQSKRPKKTSERNPLQPNWPPSLKNDQSYRPPINTKCLMPSTAFISQSVLSCSNSIELFPKFMKKILLSTEMVLKTEN